MLIKRNQKKIGRINKENRKNIGRINKENRKNKAGSKGFEPPTSGLEAQRYILAKPRALFANSTAEYEMRLLR